MGRGSDGLCDVNQDNMGVGGKEGMGRVAPSAVLGPEHGWDSSVRFMAPIPLLRGQRAEIDTESTMPSLDQG